MKRLITLQISLLIVLNLSAQIEEEDILNVKVTDLVSIPNSPEAAAFIEYGNNTVSMFTGTPDISVPIHVLKSRKLSLPVSLTYSPGVKVDQIATEVGLGWNLNAGGTITRNVVGMTDNYTQGDHLPYYSDKIHSSANSSFVVKDAFYSFENGPADGVTTNYDFILDYFEFRKAVLEGEIDSQPDTYSSPSTDYPAPLQSNIGTTLM